MNQQICQIHKLLVTSVRVIVVKKKPKILNLKNCEVKMFGSVSPHL